MKKNIKIILLIVVALTVLGGGYGLYLFNMPHRDVQSEDARFLVEAEQFANEFMEKADESNAKYLDNVVEVSGVVSEISEDQLKQKLFF